MCFCLLYFHVISSAYNQLLGFIKANHQDIITKSCAAIWFPLSNRSGLSCSFFIRSRFLVCLEMTLFFFSKTFLCRILLKTENKQKYIQRCNVDVLNLVLYYQICSSFYNDVLCLSFPRN